MSLPQEIYDLVLSFIAEPLYHSTNIIIWDRRAALKTLTQCRLAARPLQETARRHLFYRIFMWDNDCTFQPRAEALLRSTGAFRYTRKFIFIQSSHMSTMEPLASILSTLADTVVALHTNRTLELVSLRFTTLAAGPVPIPMSVRSVIHRLMSTPGLVHRLELTSIRCHPTFFDSPSVMVPELYLDDIHVDESLPVSVPATAAAGGRVHLVTDCSFEPSDPALVERVRCLTIADGKGVTPSKISSLLALLSYKLEEFSVCMTHDTIWGLGMYDRATMLPRAPGLSSTFQNLTTISLLYESQGGIPYPPLSPGERIDVPTTFPLIASQFLELFLPFRSASGSTSHASPAPNLGKVTIRANITLHITPSTPEYYEEPWDEKYIDRQTVHLYAPEEDWQRLDSLLCRPFFASRFASRYGRNGNEPTITLVVAPFVETRGPGGPYAEDKWEEERPLWDAMRWPEVDVREGLKRALGSVGKEGEEGGGCPWVRLVVRSERRVDFWARK